MADKPNTEPSKQISFDWNRFFDIPEVRQALSQLPDVYKESQNIKERATNKTGTRFILMTTFLFASLITTVIVLTVASKISTEGTSFLLGVIITGAISVIRDFTGGG